MALLAGVVSFIKAYYPDFPDEALYAIVGAFMGYVAIEGAVDAAAQLAKWLAEKNAGVTTKEGDADAGIPTQS
jgi:hypothetical protein